MQSLENNFLLSANKTCRGFDRYLEKSRQGRWFVFNWEFFLFSPFWFAAHKMYFHALLYLTFFTTLYVLSGFPPFHGMKYFFLTSSFCLLLVYSFLSYRLYSNHCQRILLKHTFQSDKFFEKVKPLGYVLGAICLILVPILSVLYISLFGITLYHLFSFFHIPLK